MLLNVIPVIQQNCNQLGRKFEKSFCAINLLTGWAVNLSCQNPKPANLEAILFFDIVKYVHVIFFHGG